MAGFDWRREVYGPQGVPYSRSGGSSFDWGSYLDPEDDEEDELRLKPITDEKPLWQILEEAGAKPEQVQLERGRDRYSRAVDAATGLGTPDDGEAPPGLLERFFRGVDYARAETFEAGRELVNALPGGKETFLLQGGEKADRLREESRERVRRREGFGDTEALSVDEDDGNIEKWAKLGAAFVGDVAVDPISYISGGGPVVGRTIAGKGVASVAGRSARDVVAKVAAEQGDDAVRRLAANLPDRQIRTFLEGRGAGNLAKASADDMLDTAAGQGWLGELAEQGFRDTAWEKYAIGSTELRRWTDELGEAGDDFFRSLPTDTQGGLRVRVPFARETTATGARAPIAFKVPGTGGGRGLEAVGLGRLSDASSATRNLVRNAPGMSWLSRNASGELGALRHSVLKNVYGQVDLEGGARGGDYLTAVALRSEKNLFDNNWDKALVKTGTETHYLLNDGVKKNGLDGAKVQQAFRHFYDERNEAYRLTKPEVAALSPDEQQGYAAARNLHGLLDQIGDAATVTFGGDADAALEMVDRYTFGALDDYTPRIRTDMEAARNLADTRPASKNPMKHREMYGVEMEKVELPDGQETLRQKRWMTVPEITEAEGREVFVDDPLTAVTEYASIMRTKIRQERLIRGMEDGGLLVDAGKATAALDENNAWRLVGEALDDAKTMRQQLADAPDAAAMRRIIGERFDPEQVLDEAVPDGPVRPAAVAEEAAPAVRAVPSRPKRFDSFDEVETYLEGNRDDWELLSAWGAVRNNIDDQFGEAAGELPAGLRGAKPKYNYGQKAFDLTFQSDVDRAVYIVTTAKGNIRSKAHKQYLHWLDDVGMDEASIMSRGKAIRTDIKARAKEAEPGRLTVSSDAPVRLDEAGLNEQAVDQLNGLLDAGEVEPFVPRQVRNPAAADIVPATGVDEDLADELSRELAREGMDVPPATFADAAEAPAKPTGLPLEQVRQQQLKLIANDEQLLATVLDPSNLPDTAEDIDGFYRTMTDVVGRYRNARPEDLAGDAADYKRWARDSGTVEIIGDGRMDQLQPTASARLERLFGPEAVGDLLTDYYRKAADTTEFRKFVEGYWKPFFTTQKFLMTVNRGPGYVSRNVAGGLWTGYLAGVTPGNWATAGKVKVAQLRALQTARKAGGSPAARAQVAEETFNRTVRDKFGDEADLILDAWTKFHDRGLGGLAPGSQLKGQIETWTKGGRSDMVAGGRRAARQGNPVQRLSQATVNNPWAKYVMVPMASTSEDFLRFGSFLRGVDQFGLEDGGDAASLLVKGTQWDYSDLSPTEANLIKNIVPFYTWARYATPMQFRAMALEPARVSKALRLQDTLREGLGEDDEDKLEALPRWVKASLGFQSKYTVGGNPVTVGLFAGEPLLDVNRMFRDPFAAEGLLGTNGFINSDEIQNNLNPFLKAGAEVVTGRDSYTGQSLDIDQESPGWAKLFGLSHTTPDGEEVTSRRATKAVEAVLPPLGQLARLFPELLGNERLEARRGTSWASQMLAAPVSTMDPWQLKNEMYQRTEAIDDRLADQHPDLTERRRLLRSLYDEGLTPGQAADWGVADMPEELLDPRDIMSVQQAETDWLSELPSGEASEFRSQARVAEQVAAMRDAGADEGDIEFFLWDQGVQDTGAPVSPYTDGEGPVVSAAQNEWLQAAGQPTRLQHFVTPERRAWEEYLGQFESNAAKDRLIAEYERKRDADRLRAQGYTDRQIEEMFAQAAG